MHRLAAVAVICALTVVPFASAQPHVDQRNLHERVIAVVPLTGTGTITDPIRPLFASANAKDYQRHTAITQFTWVPADDGRRAIVEFVAQDRAALAPLLRDSRVLKVFQRGKHKRGDIELELKKFRKDFDLDAFGGGKGK